MTYFHSNIKKALLQTKYMVIRIIIYGLIGWLVEVVFTGIGSLVSGSWYLTGYTYLWMFPIYAMAIFLEPLHDRIRYVVWPVRGFIYVGVIFFIEYMAGFILDMSIGFCPWDYTGLTSYTLDGYIRLDFLPFWFLAGLLFERLHDFLDYMLDKILAI